jgi:hypothetical protein
MKTKVLYLFILLLCPLRLTAEICENIVGPAAVTIATSYGFQFKINKISGSGHCHKLENGSAILYIAEQDAVICESTFFSGIKLHNDWKMAPAPTFNGNFEYVDKGQPKYGTNIPEFTIRVESKDALSTLELATITLEGPDCENWKDAFKGGS